jgi:hypothetical protein
MTGAVAALGVVAAALARRRATWNRAVWRRLRAGRWRRHRSAHALGCASLDVAGQACTAVTRRGADTASGHAGGSCRCRRQASERPHGVGHARGSAAALRCEGALLPHRDAARWRSRIAGLARRRVGGRAEAAVNTVRVRLAAVELRGRAVAAILARVHLARPGSSADVTRRVAAQRISAPANRRRRPGIEDTRDVA